MVPGGSNLLPLLTTLIAGLAAVYVFQVSVPTTTASSGGLPGVSSDDDSEFCQIDNPSNCGDNNNNMVKSHLNSISYLTLS